MSMICYLRLISEREVPSLNALDDEQIADFLFPEDDETNPAVDIDKSWHAIHFLLCGDPDVDDSTESMAILGGSEIGPDLGYGPLRFLSAHEVEEVADALDQIEPTELIGRFDPQRLQAAEVYPEIWNDGEDLLPYIRENYEKLRALYRQGRKSGEAILLWLA